MMNLPTQYDDDILGYETGFGSTLPDGTPLTSPPTRVYSLTYPPIGFFPFYGIGNGDYHGFYWPIGAEKKPPIIGFSSHDAWSLIPENSSILSLYQCQLARSQDDEDCEDGSQYFDLAKQSLKSTPEGHDIRDVPHDDYDTLLTIDSQSPYYLCASADMQLANGELDLAETSYRKAINILPEYVAAHFGLASLLRRLRRPEEATIHLRLTLIGPIVFYGGSFWSDTSLPGKFRADWQRKALLWLQRSKIAHESIEGDPFVESVGELTFQSGLAQNPDMDILQNVMDKYTAEGQFDDAARIWQLIGDRASSETTSFRERYSLTPSVFGARLAELYELAGNELRSKLVRNMLSLLDKPDGLYL